jgi:hypothetical protein
MWKNPHFWLRQKWGTRHPAALAEAVITQRTNADPKSPTLLCFLFRMCKTRVAKSHALNLRPCGEQNCLGEFVANLAS